jgi:cell wall assembly regulator SMI1
MFQPVFFNPLPGATEEELRATESSLGVRLPEDVRASYLIHNGMADTGAFFENQHLLSLQRVVDHWNMSNEGQEYLLKEYGDVKSKPTGPIRNDWWNKGWIPITDSGGGGILCIDMTPGAGGRIGQVIRYHHECGPTVVLAPSLREFFSQFADHLEAGKYERDFGWNIARVEGVDLC